MQAALFHILVIMLWFTSAAIDYADFCYLWQLKEYRLDRMRDFFSSKPGRLYWFRYNLFFRSIIALTLFFWPLNTPLPVQFVLFLLFGLDLIRGVQSVLRHTFHRPVVTSKSVSIIILSMMVEFLFARSSHDWTTIFLALVLRFFILSTIVGLLYIVTRFIKKMYIRQATKKLQRYTHLRVIGITGSYGKTTVKQFLAHILKAKYRVIATPKHVNTDIGVARFILSTSFEDVDVFVVEMGAYRIGDIQVLADMAKPSIGVLTAISDQHLSLFGGIRNTQIAKYELLRALPTNGLAVTNTDNEYCREWIPTLHCQVKTFGTETDYKPTLQVCSTDQTKQGIRCDFSYGTADDLIHIDASIPGAHNCMNLAPCIIVARYLGLDTADIQRQCDTLHETVLTLKPVPFGNAILIDDTYNSNPTGFKSALHYLATFPSERRRIVVTRGMYELGENSTEAHECVGNEIAFSADELVLISREFEEPLRKGVGEKYHTKITIIEDPEALLAYLEDLRQTQAVILLENRLPSLVMKKLRLPH